MTPEAILEEGQAMKCKYCQFQVDGICGCARCRSVKASGFCDKYEAETYEKEKELDMKIIRRKISNGY